VLLYLIRISVTKIQEGNIKRMPSINTLQSFSSCSVSPAFKPFARRGQISHAETDHRFTEKEDDWGFSNFMPLQELVDKKSEFMPDGTLHIQVKMQVQLDEKYTGMTRQRTGFVGLKNQVRTKRHWSFEHLVSQAYIPMQSTLCISAILISLPLVLL
jgi:hypothetical protein